MMRRFTKPICLLLCILMMIGVLSVGSFAGAAAMPFTDVKVGRWSYEYISTLYNAGIINGVSSTKFEPGANITRGAFVKILGGIEGINVSNYSGSSFEDVPASAWYAPYVKWAVSAGVTNGISAKKFNPDGQITRQDMATMIYRYANFRGIGLAKKTAKVYFTDMSGVATYARTPVNAMQRAGIINGINNGDYTYRFAPTSKATREEASKMLCVVYEMAKNPTAQPHAYTQAEGFAMLKDWIVANQTFQYDDGTPAVAIDLGTNDAEYIMYYEAQTEEIILAISIPQSTGSAYVWTSIAVNGQDKDAYLYFYTSMQGEDFGGGDVIYAPSFNEQSAIRFEYTEGSYADDAEMIKVGQNAVESLVPAIVVQTNQVIEYYLGVDKFDMSIFGFDYL